VNASELVGWAVGLVGEEEAAGVDAVGQEHGLGPGQGWRAGKTLSRQNPRHFYKQLRRTTNYIWCFTARTCYLTHRLWADVDARPHHGEVLVVGVQNQVVAASRSSICVSKTRNFNCQQNCYTKTFLNR
jgi:hypothetical protein